jgi:hypothetical protein
MEPRLEGLVSGVSKRNKPVDELVRDLPDIFDHTKWTFSPQGFLEEEQMRVEAAVAGVDLAELLLLIPGKQFLPVAAMQAGMAPEAYIKLIVNGLTNQPSSFRTLGDKLDAALSPYLPARYAPVTKVPALT